MKILIVTQYFWPESFRINDLCDELVKRDHDVTVLTGKPNYPTGVVFPDFKNNPESFSEYKGCNVVRVPMLTRGQSSSIKLMLNYFSFALSASFAGAWKLKKQDFDMIFVFEPSPITVGLPAIFLKKIKKAPIVFWVQDLWPETLEAVGAVNSQRVLGVVGKLVAFIYKRCDLVLGQSKSFLDGIAKYCQQPSKIHYFPNWSEDIFSEINNKTVPEITEHTGYFKVLFAGNIGDAQDFPSIILSLLILKKQKAKVKLFVVGDGRAMEAVKQEVHRLALNEYVYFLGRHPLETMPEFFASADALLVTLKNNPVFAMTIPSKVQSYMAAGKPVLTMLSGEGSRVIDEANCGLTAQSGDFEKLAQNIIQLTNSSAEVLTEMGSNARIYAKQEFDRDQLISKLEAWFEELANAKDYH